jgi:putative NIF3 family GTP cyclohydrolase 1 type 2
MVARAELDAYLNALLETARFQDYGPNGLQVEGKAEVHKIVSGVTASLALIEAAISHASRCHRGSPRPVLEGP